MWRDLALPAVLPQGTGSAQTHREGERACDQTANDHTPTRRAAFSLLPHQAAPGAPQPLSRPCTAVTFPIALLWGRRRAHVGAGEPVLTPQRGSQMPVSNPSGIPCPSCSVSGCPHCAGRLWDYRPLAACTMERESSESSLLK